MRLTGEKYRVRAVQQIPRRQGRQDVPTAISLIRYRTEA